MSKLFIGIDLGTSGCRLCLIDENKQRLKYYQQDINPAQPIKGRIEQEAHLWWTAVEKLMFQLLADIDPQAIQAICINGTSGTVLACDKNGQPLAPALMYNDSSSQHEANLIKKAAPKDSAAQGSSSGLAKILQLHQRLPQADHFLHQADWIAAKFTGCFCYSDENNALKSGYDAVNRQWPDWLDDLGVPQSKLPKVLAAGKTMSKISANTAKHFKLKQNVKVIAGTTDSLAAFIATGAHKLGDAVSSLGSTLVLKIITDTPIYNAEMGIYSHRLGEHWLAGGASNSGGAVLLKYFSSQQIQEMSEQINEQQLSGLHYYPLLRKGERFPQYAPDKEPLLTPRPHDDVLFFQAMLEGIAYIEKDGYKKLQQLGAGFPTKIMSCGGGSTNKKWQAIRQRIIGAEIEQARISDACYGSALLALRGIELKVVS